MTGDTQPGRDGHRRPRSGAASATSGFRGGAGHPAHAVTPTPGPGVPSVQGHRTGDPGLAGVVPLLAVLLVTVVGVYVAWRLGSAGGGNGGVIAGAALLVSAIARLLLPARLAGLLANRRRVIDVVTLAALGTALLIAGLVLPR